MNLYSYSINGKSLVVQVSDNSWTVRNNKQEVVAQGSCHCRKHNLDSARRKVKHLLA